jgi:hypothetical protein
MRIVLCSVVLLIVWGTSPIYPMDDVFEALSKALPPLRTYPYDEREEKIAFPIKPLPEKKSKNSTPNLATVFAAKTLLASQFDRTQLRQSLVCQVTDQGPREHALSMRSINMFRNQPSSSHTITFDSSARHWSWGPSWSEDGLPSTSLEKMPTLDPLQAPPVVLKPEPLPPKILKRKSPVQERFVRRSVRARSQVIPYTPHEPYRGEKKEKVKPSYSIEGGGYQCNICQMVSINPPIMHVVCKHFIGVRKKINLFQCTLCKMEFHSRKVSLDHPHPTAVKPEILAQAHTRITYLEDSELNAGDHESN